MAVFAKIAIYIDAQQSKHVLYFGGVGALDTPETLVRKRAKFRVWNVASVTACADGEILSEKVQLSVV
jgi:hypothetical protein